MLSAVVVIFTAILWYANYALHYTVTVTVCTESIYCDAFYAHTHAHKCVDIVYCSYGNERKWKRRNLSIDTCHLRHHCYHDEKQRRRWLPMAATTIASLPLSPRPLWSYSILWLDAVWLVSAAVVDICFNWLSPSIRHTNPFCTAHLSADCFFVRLHKQCW